MLIPHIYVSGCFGNVLVIFGYIWGLIAFLKELVKFIIERGNFEELVLF